jgi:hypothetical protein
LPVLFSMFATWLAICSSTVLMAILVWVVRQDDAHASSQIDNPISSAA